MMMFGPSSNSTPPTKPRQLAVVVGDRWTVSQPIDLQILWAHSVIRPVVFGERDGDWNTFRIRSCRVWSRYWRSRENSSRTKTQYNHDGMELCPGHYQSWSWKKVQE